MPKSDSYLRLKPVLHSIKNSRMNGAVKNHSMTKDSMDPILFRSDDPHLILFPERDSFKKTEPV